MPNYYQTSTPLSQVGAVLSIDLTSIKANFEIIRKQLSGAEAGAVVKANGYGLGAERIAGTLAKAGCKKFFVANVDEGIKLRAKLPNIDIYILNGLFPGTEEVYHEHNLSPILGSLGEIKLWKQFSSNKPFPCCIHVDTGMLRLGLEPNEIMKITDDVSIVEGLDVRFIMSHLASADEPNNLQNETQLSSFRIARKYLPMGRATLAASSGIFLGRNFHFDLVRPGIAIYGGNPNPGKQNPMIPTISLKAQIKQIRNAQSSETIGYGASHKLSRQSQIATVAVGYADGFLRSLSNNSCGYINNFRVPLVGRVSMDLATFDVTDVPKKLAVPGQWLELIGPNHTIDQVAKEAGTIAHEVLTSLGERYHRVYKSN